MVQRVDTDKMAAAALSRIKANNFNPNHILWTLESVMEDRDDYCARLATAEKLIEALWGTVTATFRDANTNNISTLYREWRKSEMS